MRLHHLEVLHAEAATPAAGEADVVAEVAEHGVNGVGRPQLLGGDVHDLGHLPVGPLEVVVLQAQEVLPALFLL